MRTFIDITIASYVLQLHLLSGSYNHNVIYSRQAHNVKQTPVCNNALTVRYLRATCLYVLLWEHMCNVRAELEVQIFIGRRVTFVEQLAAYSAFYSAMCMSKIQGSQVSDFPVARVYL